jgi:hypothetical protein
MRAKKVMALPWGAVSLYRRSTASQSYEAGGIDDCRPVIENRMALVGVEVSPALGDTIFDPAAASDRPVEAAITCSVAGLSIPFSGAP